MKPKDLAASLESIPITPIAFEFGECPNGVILLYDLIDIIGFIEMRAWDRECFPFSTSLHRFLA